MAKWNVYAHLNEVVEADNEFEAEQKGLEILERHGIRAEEIIEEDEAEG